MTDDTPTVTEFVDQWRKMLESNERLRGDLKVATTIISMAYGILRGGGPDAIERAKGLLSSFIEDQIANGL